MSAFKRASLHATGTRWLRFWPTTFPSRSPSSGERGNSDMVEMPKSTIPGDRRVGAHGCDIDGHRDPRAAPRPESYPLLGTRSRPDAFRTSAHVIEIDADERIVGDRRVRRSKTSTPPSRNSTPATSPAKQPPTRAHGRSSLALTPRSTDTSSLDDAGLCQHRPPTATPFGSSDDRICPRRGLTRTSDNNIETVHRLDDLGAVVTHAAHGPRKKDLTPSGGGSPS